MHTEMERLEHDLRRVVDDAENLISELAASTGNGSDQLRNKVEASLQTARTTLNETRNAVVGRVQHAADVTAEYVGEHMWQSLAVATAIGVLIGMLLRRH